MPFTIRPATSDDANPMSTMLFALSAIGKRGLPSDAAWVLENYIEHPDKISCALAVSGDGEVLGLQSLRLARPDNPYGTPPGWATIGTHVHPDAARQGIGKALFATTLAAAQKNTVPAIDAKIGTANAGGLAYYSSIGFVANPDANDEGRKVFWLR